jgi:YheC/D like ATP-grasp
MFHFCHICITPGPLTVYKHNLHEGSEETMGISTGKWKKYQLMKKHGILARYLPETYLLNEKTFWHTIGKYGAVMIKPTKGYMGKGIVQVSSKENDLYEFHVLEKKYTVEGRKQAFEHLLKHYCLKKHYIVQQKIPLVTVKNSPYDIRVMVQRRKKQIDWMVTGKLAKVAAKGFILTNYPKYLIPADDAIKQSSFKAPCSHVQEEIDRISVLTAQYLSDYYTNTRTFGLDIGLDDQANIWIIEANLAPSVSIFKALKDEEAYKRILKYRRG